MIKTIKDEDGITVKAEGKSYELFTEFIAITKAIKKVVEENADEQKTMDIMEALFHAGVRTPVEKLDEKQKKNIGMLLTVIMGLNKREEEHGQQNSNDQP